jgi:hypothetical protein
MRPYRPDYWLWGLLTAAFSAGLGLAEYRHDPDRGIVSDGLYWVGRGFDDPGYYISRLGPLLLGMLAVAAAAAWAAHALLVLCGIRLPAVRLFRTPVEAADYDDRSLPDADPPHG